MPTIAERTYFAKDELFCMYCYCAYEILQMEKYNNENCRDALAMLGCELELRLYSFPIGRYYAFRRARARMEETK